ncbi:Conserved_hypothetical protein [Hexamita inflata]|uniref:Uncharacterized protein n=1 Tax=Hexamita inflata TaxID=28002 RepID=A0AA86N939_9EUKA|nr:Conserved hypothetical protein [Hexamita inflata]
MHLRFVFACMLLGIKDCTPKKVLQLFGDSKGVTTGVIGSHLQKVRNQMISKDYKVTILENWMVPKDVHDDNLTAISKKWKEPGFTGFSAQEIQKYLK